MEQLVQHGKVKDVGLEACHSKDLLQSILVSATIKPSVNLIAISGNFEEKMDGIIAF